MSNAEAAVPAYQPYRADASDLAIENRSKLAASKADLLIADGLTYLLRTMRDDHIGLWPRAAMQPTADPVDGADGVAGALATLTRASVTTGRADVRDALSRASLWLARRLGPDRQPEADSVFGRAAAVWALLDAALHTNSDVLTVHAVDIAMRIPVRAWAAGRSRGAATAGLTQLRFWVGVGELAFLERAEELADELIATPSTVDADDAAAIGEFWLATALATGRDDLLDAAVATARILVMGAERGPYSARWPRRDHASSDTAPRDRYCDSSAVGSFLLRVWRHNGDPALLELAREAAAATHCDRWFAVSSLRHGLAGAGELLVDLAQDGIAPAQAFAADLVDCLDARHISTDGLRLIPDRPDAGMTIGHATGLSGVLSFLMRYRHGGQRLWQADEVYQSVSSGRP